VTTISLSGGERLDVRPIREGDKPLLRQLHESLSPESQYKRFLSPVPQLSDQMQCYLTECDHHVHEGLFAFDHETGTPVATARFIRCGDAAADTAEFAITVTDAWQRRGVGTALFRLLADRAREEGIRHLVGDVLSTNTAMHHVMRDYGPTTVKAREAGVETLVVDV
jgi:acetyltransferase